MTTDVPRKAKATAPRRTISKARLYKEVKKQAQAYDMLQSSVTLADFLEQLGGDVIEDATS